MEERSGGIQVISRAAAILRIMRDEEDGLSLGQIADRAGLPRSTVQRIVGALQQEGFVSTGAARGGFGLGPELRSMVAGASPDMAELCRPLLEALAARTGETVDLARHEDGQMIFVHQVPGRHRLRAVSSVGEVFPLTNTANGVAALSLMNEDKALQLAEAEWRRNGESGDTEAFLQTLASVRACNLAYDLDLHTVGISAIGTAFRDRAGRIYAISVPIPSSRYEKCRTEVETALLSLRDDVQNLASVQGEAA